jgi:hypothetical protein
MRVKGFGQPARDCFSDESAKSQESQRRPCVSDDLLEVDPGRIKGSLMVCTRTIPEDCRWKTITVFENASIAKSMKKIFDD